MRVAHTSTPLRARLRGSACYPQSCTFGAFQYDNIDRLSILRLSGRLSVQQQEALDSVNLDVRTVLKKLEIEPEYMLYACCPDCSALYPPNPSRATDPYPHHCTKSSTPDKDRCGAHLVQSRKKRGTDEHLAWVPIKIFAFQSMKTWLGQLCSRIGVERQLEDSWKTRGSRQWTDIMDAPAIQGFLGPDNITHFRIQTNGALHLVFGLFIDWFNPFGNKKAGKSHSIGGIYMTCLNLPIHLRYRTENIYLVGIIPGPQEPTLSQLNHFLAPLVDDLLGLWYEGVYLSKTATRATGRLVRVALIPLICDLPALRKSAGFAGHSSSDHMCSFCLQTKKQIHGLDRTKWKRRSWEEHL